ncbi:MAG: hypothetical protein FH762_08125 [Firmicutes bacterium]|nr:hypothetical protein [Bacillota bacterium]
MLLVSLIIGSIFALLYFELNLVSIGWLRIGVYVLITALLWIINLFYIKKDEFIYSNSPAGITNASVRKWFQESIQGKLFVSDVYISAITRNPCITVIKIEEHDSWKADIIDLKALIY